MKIGYFAAGFVALSGCAMQTLTMTDAQQFANLTPEQFIAQRFSDIQNKRVGNIFYYSAYFNELNSRQLYRPTVEIVNYCKAQKGFPVRTQSYNGNPMQNAFRNPTLDAFQAASAARSMGYNDLVAVRAGQFAYEDAERLNNLLDKNRAESTYGNAAESGAYGVFECRAKQDDNNSAKWKISVVPIGYVPAKPGNALSSHKMIIEIKNL